MPAPRFALFACLLLFTAAAHAGTIQFEQSASSVTESAGFLSVNVTRTGSLTETATVVCRSIPGTATSSDFFARERTLTFLPGESVRTFNVYLRPDWTDEPDQTLQLELSSPSAATLGNPATTTVTIVDSDPTPAIRVYDVVATEGTDAAAVFTLGLSTSTEWPVSVDYTTVDGTATAGSDYTAQHGTVTKSTFKISIPILTDTTVEPAETFVLRLSNPVNATLGIPEAEAGIVDPEGPPALVAITTFAYVWPNVLTPLLGAKLTRPATETVSFDIVPWIGPARHLTIPPGGTLAYFEVGLNSNACGFGYRIERFEVTSAVNAGIARRRAEAYINDTGRYPFNTFLPWTYEMKEGAPKVTFYVRDGCLPTERRYGMVVEEATGREGKDFAVTLNHGISGDSLYAAVIDDADRESSETFSVQFYGGFENRIDFTILDNEPATTADLSATVTAPLRVVAGAPVTFHIVVSNAGPDAAESVVVTDTLPPGSIFLAPKASPAVCSASGNVVTCGLGTMAKGEFAALDITAQLPVGLLTNSVTVSSAAGDPTPASVSTPIDVLAALSDIPTVGEWALLAIAAVLAMVGIARLRL